VAGAELNRASIAERLERGHLDATTLMEEIIRRGVPQRSAHEIVGKLVQQIDRPHPGTYLGKGKIDELRELASAREASLIIFDDELSPSQGKNIEDATGTRVMDRAELILDIFATRARTSEAKLQVELAQLEYMLPRLTRMWTHLEKTRGGIGMRGPGETQLETDRRLINTRIKQLKEKLGDVTRAREISARRRGAFRPARWLHERGQVLILRGLSGARDVFVEDRLFATLDPLTREVDLGDNNRVLLTDTVGSSGSCRPPCASFRATLEGERCRPAPSRDRRESRAVGRATPRRERRS
jgi:GTP-binding protein HflX